MGRKPFLASGKILGDYSVLIKYFEICMSKGGECMDLFPSREILDDIKEMAENKGYSYLEVLGEIRVRIEDKINCDIAVEAYKMVHGISVSCEVARMELLKEIVAWYLEAAETLGLVKLKESWKP